MNYFKKPHGYLTGGEEGVVNLHLTVPLLHAYASAPTVDWGAPNGTGIREVSVFLLDEGDPIPVHYFKKEKDDLELVAAEIAVRITTYLDGEPQGSCTLLVEDLDPEPSEEDHHGPYLYLRAENDGPYELSTLIWLPKYKVKNEPMIIQNNPPEVSIILELVADAKQLLPIQDVTLLNLSSDSELTVETKRGGPPPRKSKTRVIYADQI